MKKITSYLLLPLLVFALVFIAVAIMMLFKQDPTRGLPWFFVILVNIGALYLISRIANPKNFKEALSYGLIWMIIVIIFDLAVTTRIIGPEESRSYFTDPKTWFSYLIVVLIPLDYATKFFIGKKLNK